MLDALPELLRVRDLEGARELLERATPEQVAQALQGVAAAEVQIALQLLDQKTAVSVFELLDPGARKAAFDLAPAVPELVRQVIELLLAERQFQTLHHLLGTMEPVDLARLLESLPAEAEAVAFRLLAKGVAVETFEQMDSEQQQRLLQSFTEERTRELVAAMSPDDRARLLDEVPASVAHRLTQLLPPEERRATLMLLAYDESSAGRVMTPDFVSLRAGMTVARALERIRRQALDKETIYYAYVTDGERHLVGTVSLKDLVLADPEAVVGDLMAPNPKAVSTHADQEEVARVLRDYDLLAVPVVDGEERLVGIVTWDDVLDIVEEEATEDIYHYGAVPMAERSYFASGVLSRSRRRLAWLLLLILVNTVTGVMIARQGDLLTEVTVLAAFIPLLIGTGGNVGAQSSTVVIRGLATGEIGRGRAALTLLREGCVGLLLGLFLGLIAFSWAMLLAGGDIRVAMVVSISLTAIAVMATLVGGGLPFLFRLVGVDPAMASAPLVTTMMDIFGVGVFFLVAGVLLHL